MLQKTITLSLFMFSLLCFSQKYSFIYEYSFKPDSLNLEKTETELMGLLVGKNESTYVSLKKIKRDSAIAEKMSGNNSSLDMHVPLNLFPQEKVSGIIMKIKKSNEVSSFRSVGVDRFKVIHHIVFNWDITDETDVILGKKCQLAKLKFKGRDYKAWFTTEIPISDGPYKFGGLPGLILKIEDEEKHHVWELKGIEKFRNLQFNLSKYVTATETQYSNALENYIKDPMSKLRELRQKINSINSTVTSPDGTTYSGAEYYRIRTKEIQDNFRKNNNHIELH